MHNDFLSYYLIIFRYLFNKVKVRVSGFIPQTILESTILPSSVIQCKHERDAISCYTINHHEKLCFALVIVFLILLILIFEFDSYGCYMKEWAKFYFEETICSKITGRCKYFQISLMKLFSEQSLGLGSKNGVN